MAIEQQIPPSGYGQHFERLNQLLLGLAPLWQLQAFECHDLPWAVRFPHLATAVTALDDENIDTIDKNQTALVATLLPSLRLDLAKAAHHAPEIQSLIDLLPLLDNAFSALRIDEPRVDEQSLADKDPAATDAFSHQDLSHFSAGIKGRKWQQITAFTQMSFLQGVNDLPVLEWCAGKGHLGRLVAKTQQVAVTSLEWQQSLCEQGQTLADKWHVAQDFICADAFEDIDIHAENSPIKAKQHAIALHACGDLHVRLLQLATAANTKMISISPCCYHLIREQVYQPLSSKAQLLAANGRGLGLTRHHLQLPLQQSVIASSKQQALRHQEVVWRLGFDSLQREITGKQHYLPVPTLKQSQLSGSFVDFCHWAASAKQLLLPKGVDFAAFLRQGQKRHALTLRIDLVSHLFRSVLETWLLLDRAIYLQESGYQVGLSEFCANSITPRNGFIQGIKY
ncbi:methyltransferase [Shewanella sp. SR44-3]|uniref:methyltransferase n=1 Tax=Shewanella sp. SR44-3 TaxID=2760936 RepID=UPI0015F8D047|nr:methyltransferase [Shewanella sp. SR44-3]MBB1270233.1 methyltransferase [Shewanella sp. SR44-3]